MSNTQAVVIGNGESRKNLDLESLKSNYTLIGCNAVHRDITVDHLVCCDRRMVLEAVKNTNNSHCKIYTRLDWHHYFRKILKNKNVDIVPKLPYHSDDRSDRPIHWGSGPYAVLLAATLNCSTVHLVGFDLYSKNGKINNVYKGTQNYLPPDKQAVDHSYWVYQISKVFENYANIEFKIYNSDDWLLPERWQRKNVEKLNIDLANQLNNNYNNT